MALFAGRSGVSSRGAATVALLVLGCALLAAVALTTPWRTFPDAGPGGSFAPAPSQNFPAAERAREDAFHRDVRPPAYLSLALGLVVVGAFGLTPLGARLVTAAGSLLGATGGARWALQVAAGVLAMAAVLRLLVLPLDAWALAVRRRYGLSTQTWGAWLGDVARTWALSTGLLLVVLLALYALIRAFPRWWWAPAAAGAAALVLALSFLYPVVVEPVFNRFTPMAEGPLRASLLELAEEDGVPVTDVLVADASRRTTALNAYVSGFGATRRIVVYDTLLSTATPAEVRLVVAHELGHADDDDVLHGTLLGAAGLAAGVCLLYLVLTWAPALRRAGVSALGDPRSLALVLLAVTVLSTLSGPLQMLISRRIETRADVHALELTRNPRTFVEMQRRLAVTNLSDLDPSPVVFALFSSHPTAPQRIAVARAWARANDVPEPAPLAPARSNP